MAPNATHTTDQGAVEGKQLATLLQHLHRRLLLLLLLLLLLRGWCWRCWW
jgi:hypothetical protein